MYTHDADPLNWLDLDDRFEIMASIAPSRTGPLGQRPLFCATGEIDSTCVDLEDELGYTDSNYDHSAQWMNAYHNRHQYWSIVCKTFFDGDGACIER